MNKVIEIVYNGRVEIEWIRIDAKPEILMEDSWTVNTTETSSSERTSTSRSSRPNIGQFDNQKSN